jgi:hypothetical protein
VQMRVMHQMSTPPRRSAGKFKQNGPKRSSTSWKKDHGKFLLQACTSE